MQKKRYNGILMHGKIIYIGKSKTRKCSSNYRLSWALRLILKNKNRAYEKMKSHFFTGPVLYCSIILFGRPPRLGCHRMQESPYIKMRREIIHKCFHGTGRVIPFGQQDMKKPAHLLRRNGEE